MVFPLKERFYIFLQYLFVINILVLYFTSDRLIYEAFSICVAFLLLSIKFQVFYLFFLALFSFLQPDSFYANFSIIYYLLSLDFLFGKKPNAIYSDNYWILILSVFVLAIYEGLNQIYSGSHLRPISFFNSPLSYGYFLCSCVIFLTIRNPKWLYFLFYTPLITGSRSATILLAPVFLKNVRSLMVIIFIIPIVAILFSDELLGLIGRSISDHGVSDSIRINSWLSFLDLSWSPSSFLFGFGRIGFGSLGYFLGGNDVIVIESSILTMAASYGCVFASIWSILFLYGIFRKKSIVWLTFFVLSFVSVFHDSLGIMILVIIAFDGLDRQRGVS